MSSSRPRNSGSMPSLSSRLRRSASEEKLNRFLVQLRQLDQLHEVHAAVASFAFRQKRVRHAEVLGNLALAEADFFSCVYQALKHIVVHSLVRSGPGLSRLSGFGFGTLLHNLSLWKP